MKSMFYRWLDLEVSPFLLISGINLYYTIRFEKFELIPGLCRTQRRPRTRTILIRNRTGTRRTDDDQNGNDEDVDVLQLPGFIQQVFKNRRPCRGPCQIIHKNRYPRASSAPSWSSSYDNLKIAVLWRSRPRSIPGVKISRPQTSFRLAEAWYELKLFKSNCIIKVYSWN